MFLHFLFLLLVLTHLSFDFVVFGSTVECLFCNIVLLIFLLLLEFQSTYNFIYCKLYIISVLCPDWMNRAGTPEHYSSLWLHERGEEGRGSLTKHSLTAITVGIKRYLTLISIWKITLTAALNIYEDGLIPFAVFFHFPIHSSLWRLVSSCNWLARFKA